MPDHTSTPAPFWRPTQDGARLILMWLGVAVAVIGAMAFALSFLGVYEAARPIFGGAAWAIPILGDATIAVFASFSLIAELNGLGSPTARWAARALVGFTIYANVAQAHGLYAKVLHGAPPVIWAAIVTIAEGLIRRLVGLNSPTRIEGIRRSLWLLRSVGKWRLWRRIRVDAIPTYREALDKDAARAAVIGRLRLHHGRFWRQKAPLGERLALKLQGRDPSGVAEILRAHQETALLLADTVPEAVSDAAPEPLETVPEPPSEDTPKPPRRRTQGRRRKGGKTPAPRRTEAELLAAASVLNAEAMAETGTAVSLRRLKSELRIGQPVAERLRTALAEAPAAVPTVPQQPVPEAVPAPIEYANGTPLD
jgi:hypothetical protein